MNYQRFFSYQQHLKSEHFFERNVAEAQSRNVAFSL